MKDSIENDITDILHKNLDAFNIDYIDKKKLSAYIKDYPIGIKNYILFQKFFYFKWPFWLHNTISVKSKTFNPVIPFLLINNNNRNGIYYSSRFLSKRFFIDPSGMISPEGSLWSIEFWISEKETLYRPQERISSVTGIRDLESFFINIKWKETDFNFTENIYGIKQDNEELITELNCNSMKNIPLILFIVIRPYNTSSLGGIESIEYNNKSRQIKINAGTSLYLEKKPDCILSGNAYLGDIDIAFKRDTSDIKCKSGLATMAFGYSLYKGDNEYNIRIPASANNYKPVKLNYSKIKNEIIEHLKTDSNKGFKLIFPDKLFQSWVYGAKMSALNFFYAGLPGVFNSQKIDFKSIYYITSGYNRMGYFSESLKIIESAALKINIKEKLNFSNILDRCYHINAVSDYFNLSRDIDYIKLKYKSLREIALPLIQYSANIKEKKKQFNINSIDNYFISEYHILDIILLSFTLFEFSYLARCLGIFNDETMFAKESTRVEKIIMPELNSYLDTDVEPAENTDKKNKKPIADNKDIHQTENIETASKAMIRNEHFAYNIFTGYPFRGNLPGKKLKAIADKISLLFNENPLYFKSIGGSDNFFSIIYAVNLLLLKDNRAHDIINKLFEFGDGRFALQEIVNPRTGFCIRGEGDSIVVLSVFFTLLRSALFMDSREGLEIFPVPKEEWFMEGFEVKIENAPSIFGTLNLKVITTKNEVQLYFFELPKYIPPQIMINLPFPAKIKQEDDFIIKKETGNSYLIYGWPSIVRFIRK